MKQPPLAQRYADGLERFLRDRSEQALRVAYELGREAVQSDVSVLNLAASHNAALAAMLRKAPPDEAASLSEAAGDFLIESLAAFEMVQRGVTEARRAAFRERRVARMLRQLTAVLAESEVAADDDESYSEIAQLVAEYARELTRADGATVTVVPAHSGRKVTAVAEGEAVDTWSDVFGPSPEVIANALPVTREIESLHEDITTPRSGRIGSIELHGEKGTLSEEAHALLAQIAQLSATALDRAGRAR